MRSITRSLVECEIVAPLWAGTCWLGWSPSWQCRANAPSPAQEEMVHGTEPSQAFSPFLFQHLFLFSSSPPLYTFPCSTTCSDPFQSSSAFPLASCSVVHTKAKLSLCFQEYDPWKSSDRICRQLIYHLTPHSKWHRHGMPRRKSQVW